MHVDELVSAARPAPDAGPGAGPGLPGDWDRRWERQLQAIHRDRRRRKRRRIVAATALPIALAIVIVAAVLPQWSGRPPSAAAAVFDAAATSVAAQPPAVPGPGQYAYTVTHNLYQATVYEPPAGTAGGAFPAVASVTYAETDQLWTDATGSGREVVTRGPFQFSSSADQAAWDASPTAQSWTTRWPPTATYTDVQNLPTDVSTLPTGPQALAGLIAAGRTGTWVDHVPPGPGATFQRAALLLAGPDRGMTPALESALYQVLAAQPGATVSAGVTGPSGAQGTAVTVTGSSPGAIDRIIIDPQTGAPLEVDGPPEPATAPVSGPAETVCDAPSGCGAMTARGVVAIGPLWTAPSPPVVVGSDTAATPAGS